MHTFFINTSKKSLDGYEVLFDIHDENKALVSMNCPMSEWYSKENGYLACVDQMSDLIDGYVELNNAFSLIVYVDLPENETYASVPRDAFHDNERDSYAQAMHILYTHVIRSTILDKLIDSGRRPQSVLLMFGEEKEFVDFSASEDPVRRTAVVEKLFELLGLPDRKTVEDIAKSLTGSDEEKKQRLEEQVSAISKKELLPGIRKAYRDDLCLWYGEVIDDADVGKANLSLGDRIYKINLAESTRDKIEHVSCPYDCFASRVNKCALALSKLNIALHVLRCVEEGTVCETVEENGKTVSRVIPFVAFRAEELVSLFRAKGAVFERRVKEIEDLEKSYNKLGLVPPLDDLDCKKFGLDSYGASAKELVVMNDTPSEDASAQKAETESPDAVILPKKGKKVEAVAPKESELFRIDGYKPFDYHGESIAKDDINKKTTPDGYIKRAMQLRMHHLDYVKALKLHVARALSNYAGKSKENKPALLRNGQKQYKSAKSEGRVLEETESIAKTAYDSITEQYMQFCAARSVAVTDIEEECNRFVTRIRQIEASLRKLKRVAIGLFAALLVLYIPFVVIQFEAIVENVLSIAVAVSALGIPILLLAVVFGFAAIAQKKKYREEWNTFWDRSNAIGAENALAAKRFDQLLSTVIPALRWIYEFRLDVEFFEESCRVADAKIEHHRLKLHHRVDAIRMILGDLDCGEAFGGSGESKEQIDYNMPFCTGEKNRRFYSIVGKDFFAPKQA